MESKKSNKQNFTLKSILCQQCEIPDQSDEYQSQNTIKAFKKNQFKQNITLGNQLQYKKLKNEIKENMYKVADSQLSVKKKQKFQKSNKTMNSLNQEDQHFSSVETLPKYQQSQKTNNKLLTTCTTKLGKEDQTEYSRESSPVQLSSVIKKNQNIIQEKIKTEQSEITEYGQQQQYQLVNNKKGRFFKTSQSHRFRRNNTNNNLYNQSQRSQYIQKDNFNSQASRQTQRSYSQFYEDQKQSNLSNQKLKTHENWLQQNENIDQLIQEKQITQQLPMYQSLKQQQQSTQNQNQQQKYKKSKSFYQKVQDTQNDHYAQLIQGLSTSKQDLENQNKFKQIQKYPEIKKLDLSKKNESQILQYNRNNNQNEDVLSTQTQREKDLATSYSKILNSTVKKAIIQKQQNLQEYDNKQRSYVKNKKNISNTKLDNETMENTALLTESQLSERSHSINANNNMGIRTYSNIKNRKSNKNVELKDYSDKDQYNFMKNYKVKIENPLIKAEMKIQRNNATQQEKEKFSEYYIGLDNMLDLLQELKDPSKANQRIANIGIPFNKYMSRAAKLGNDVNGFVQRGRIQMSYLKKDQQSLDEQYEFKKFDLDFPMNDLQNERLFEEFEKNVLQKEQKQIKQEYLLKQKIFNQSTEIKMDLGLNKKINFDNSDSIVNQEEEEQRKFRLQALVEREKMIKIKESKQNFVHSLSQNLKHEGVQVGIDGSYAESKRLNVAVQYKFSLTTAQLNKTTKSWAFKLSEGNFDWICFGIGCKQKILNLSYTFGDGQFGNIISKENHGMYMINNIGVSFHSNDLSQNYMHGVPFYIYKGDVIILEYSSNKQELSFIKKDNFQKGIPSFKLYNIQEPEQDTLHPFVLFGKNECRVEYIDHIKYIPYYFKTVEKKENKIEQLNNLKIEMKQNIENLLKKNNLLEDDTEQQGVFLPKQQSLINLEISDQLDQKQNKNKNNKENSKFIDQEEKEEVEQQLRNLPHQNSQQKEDITIIEQIKKEQKGFRQQANQIDYDRINDQKFKSRKNQKKIDKLLTVMLREFYKMMDLKLNFTIVYRENLFNNIPFYRKNSKQYFDAIKDGDIIKVSKFISQDKYIVYDVNETLQTGLHVAVKREKLNIVRILIDSNISINQRDSLHRTALYYAFRTKNSEIIRYLLVNKIIPWSGGPQGDFNQFIKQRQNDPKDRQLVIDLQFLRQAYFTHCNMMMSSYKYRNQIWNERYYNFECINTDISV